MKTRGAPIEIDHADGAWRFTPVAARMVACDRVHDVARVEVVVEATGPYWFLALVDLQQGTANFRHGDALIASPRTRHVVFLPPFSFVQCELRQARRRLRVLISDRDLGGDLPREPVLFETEGDALPASLDGVRSLLAAAVNPVAITRHVRPSRIVARAKQLLDTGYRGQSLATAHAQVLAFLDVLLSGPAKRGWVERRDNDQSTTLRYGAHTPVRSLGELEPL